MILIVEDDKSIIECLDDVLIDKFIIATDAAQAIKLLKEKSFSIVFCDVHGIEKDRFTAHDVVKFCASAGTPCFITTNNPYSASEFRTEYGITCVDKLELLSKLHVN